MADIKSYFIGIETELKGCVSSVVKSSLSLRDFGNLILKALYDYLDERGDQLADLYIYEEDAHGERVGDLVFNQWGVFAG